MPSLSTNLGLTGREKEEVIYSQNALGRVLRGRLSEFCSSPCGTKAPEEIEKKQSVLSTYVLTKLAVGTGSHCPIL